MIPLFSLSYFTVSQPIFPSTFPIYIIMFLAVSLTSVCCLKWFLVNLSHLSQLCLAVSDHCQFLSHVTITSTANAICLDAATRWHKSDYCLHYKSLSLSHPPCHFFSFASPPSSISSFPCLCLMPTYHSPLFMFVSDSYQPFSFLLPQHLCLIHTSPHPISPPPLPPPIFFIVPL